MGAILIPLAIGSPPARAQSNPCGQVTCAEVIAYLRTLDGPTLIRIAWAGTGQEGKALAIARRESGFNCAADNRRSSAAGLMQTLSIHRPRAERLGLSWVDIEGPDCWSDVILAFDIWEDSGWRPWSG